MISVSEARRIVVSRTHALPAEMVPLRTALDRVLAADIVARISRPASAISAMDGYAVRAADIARLPAHLRLVGIAAAGGGCSTPVQPGEAVRILTGAQLPPGSDSIVIQEHTYTDGDLVIVLQAPVPGRWIRPTGIDFTADTPLVAAGRRLSARDLALAAAANVTVAAVRQRPRVAVLTTGDELVLPGEWRSAEQTINCNSVYLEAELKRWGAITIDLGMIPDDVEALERSLCAAAGADVLLTVGGASVGDRDLILPVLDSLGFTLGFQRVAMRPGKPTSFGWLRDTPILVLPGNPVSAVVTMLRLARPLIDRLLGVIGDEQNEGEAVVSSALPENDEREDYLRAKLSPLRGGGWEVAPFAHQDSALTAILAAADCLIVRPPRAPKARAGDVVPIIRLL